MVKLSKEKIKSCLEGSGGILANIARKCGTSRAAITKYLQKKENSDLMDLVKEEREKILDLCENKLIELIIEKDLGAIKYYSSMLGKHRGFTENPAIINMLNQEQRAYTFKIIKPENNPEFFEHTKKIEKLQVLNSEFNEDDIEQEVEALM